MSSGILSIGNSALSAAYTALRTTGNNIANANTPGYSRQVAVLTPQPGASAGGFYQGQGVMIAEVQRIYDDFLTQQANLATAQSSAAESRRQRLSQLQNAYADSTSGVGATVDQFFRALQDVAQRPADPAARQALLSAANQMAARFNDVGDRAQEFRTNTDQQLQLEVGNVNQTTLEIARLNDRIAQARGTGISPNDLLDQRDVAIRRLNSSIRVSTVSQDDGAVNLFLANGQALVVGNRANQLTLTTDALDPQELRIAVNVSGQLRTIDPAKVGGGTIDGLLRFRSEDLPRFESDLGRLAVSLSELFNAQHRLGDDRNGNAGGDFFTPLSAASYPAPTNGNAATQISVTFADPTQLQSSDYRVEYAGGQYTLKRLSDGQTWTSATPDFNRDGLAISLTNTPPADGDVFLIQPLRGVARNLAVAITQPAEVAAAAPVKASIPLTNVGTLAVDDLTALSPRSANLKDAATIAFGAGNTYTITSGAVTQSGTFVSGQPISFAGRWTITLRGTPQAGDTVNLSANVGGIGDNRNMLKLAALQSAHAVDGASLSSAYSTLVARIGGDVQGAEMDATALRSILDGALNAESSVSGVNLDEEASRLMQYQQQYQAAAKLLAIAKQTFDEILTIGR